jgi:hypothetical protein
LADRVVAGAWVVAVEVMAGAGVVEEDTASKVKPIVHWPFPGTNACFRAAAKFQ